MKALLMSGFGSPEDVVQLMEIPDPSAPKAGQILVSVEYAPINNSELLKIRGIYPRRPTHFPAGLGNEGVGRVLSAGPDVQEFKIGDRVPIPLSQDSWCEQVLMPTRGLFALPDNADSQQLSMLCINPPTAAVLLSDFVDLKPGDWLIQNSGNSSVGRCVRAMALERGIGTLSIVRKLDFSTGSSFESTDVVLVDGPGMAERVARATGGAPIRLAIDGVGGASTAFLSGCLTAGGTRVMYSMVSGQPGSVSGLDLIFRDVTIRGLWISSPRFQESVRLLDGMRLGAKLIAAGKLVTPIAGIYPLADVRQALLHAQAGGKILFKIAASSNQIPS